MYPRKAHDLHVYTRLGGFHLFTGHQISVTKSVTPHIPHQGTVRKANAMTSATSALCAACHGDGLDGSHEAALYFADRGELSACPVCGGSGRAAVPLSGGARQAIAQAIHDTWDGHPQQMPANALDLREADAVLATPVVGDKTVADCIAITRAIVEADPVRAVVGARKVLGGG